MTTFQNPRSANFPIFPEPARIKVSTNMLTCIMRAAEINKLSDGAFDPTIAPLGKLWREARKTKKMPDSAAIDSARKLVGMDKVVIDEKQSTVDLKLAGMRLDFGGIAKGMHAILQALPSKKRVSAAGWCRRVVISRLVTPLLVNGMVY